LLFLYKEVLLIDLLWLDNVVRAKQPQRLPCVLTRTEVRSVLIRISGIYGLMANLLYGTGMRLMECARLRVKDVDFERGEILIRDGKGGKDRVIMLPESVAGSLQAHFLQRRALFDDDTRLGKTSVYLPDALERKYPNAPTQRLNWPGNIFFPPVVFRSIRTEESNAAII
jgi:integrase